MNPPARARIRNRSSFMMLLACTAAPPARAAEPPARPEVPAAIAVPAAATVTSRLHAVGAQIYGCAATSPGGKTFAWKLVAPEAALTDARGAPAGRHGAGPSWTSTDGSSVTATKVGEAAAPAKDAAAWLLLRATSTTGDGAFGRVTYVQRVATSKGKAPATGCTGRTAGAKKRVAYAADYYFYEGGASEPTLLAVGSDAPAISAVTFDGQKVSLADLAGKLVVLYFYPKDDTPGCTREACDFRDNWGKLRESGVAVFGVSTQGNESHKAFTDKYHLPFPLLPDEHGVIAARFGVPVVGGTARRITYLIGKDGKIAHVWPSVTPAGHAAEVMSAIAQLPPSP